MKIKDTARKIRKVIQTTLFWLIIQMSIIYSINTLLMAVLYFNPIRYGYRYTGVKGNMVLYAFFICFYIAMFIYTLVGSIILNCIPINTRKWWKKIGIFYIHYLALTVFGAAFIARDWFWEGHANLLLLFTWLAPLLWLAEIEAVHLYWNNQRQKYLDPPKE